MANPQSKNVHNVSGKYYTDLNCIDCDKCREIAPVIFARDDEEGLTYVRKQPTSYEERALADEAVACCPTESIGDDG